MRQIVKYLAGCLRVFATPGCWIQNNPFSRDWENFITQLMSHNKFIRESNALATIGGVRVWIENHPYASFSPHVPGIQDVRPSRITILRAGDKLAKETPDPLLELIRKSRAGRGSR